MLVQQFQFLEGANTNVSPLLQPPNSCPILNGVDPAWKLGALNKDTGYSKVGDTLQSGKSVTGLFNFRQTASTQKILATINNSAGTNLTLKYNNAGTWTDIVVGSTWDGYEDSKVEMEQFLGYCFFVGYDSTDGVFLPVASLTGTTFSTSANVTSMPQGKYMVRYRDRLYVINAYASATAYPYRAYFSSIPSSGAITWTPTDLIDTGDYGDELTGGGVNWDRLMLFTRYEAIMYDQSQKKKAWETGCSNHRTIKNSGPYMFWANTDGIWRSSGGQPENVGGPVIDFLRAGSPVNFFAEIVDRKYYLYVGTVTVNGTAYTNCTLIYDIPTQMWWWRESADNFTAFAKYNDSGTTRLYMGAADGDVHDKGKYTDSTLKTSDNGSAIHSDFECAPIYLGNMTFEKEIMKLTAYAERAGGLKLKGRVIDRNSRALTPYQPLGELRNYVNSFDIDISKGVFLQIAGFEYSSLPYWSYYGHEFEIQKYSEILK